MAGGICRLPGTLDSDQHHGMRRARVRSASAHSFGYSKIDRPSRTCSHWHDNGEGGGGLRLCVHAGGGARRTSIAGSGHCAAPPLARSRRRTPGRSAWTWGRRASRGPSPPANTRRTTRAALEVACRRRRARGRAGAARPVRGGSSLLWCIGSDAHTVPRRTCAIARRESMPNAHACRVHAPSRAPYITASEGGGGTASRSWPHRPLPLAHSRGSCAVPLSRDSAALRNPKGYQDPSCV